MKILITGGTGLIGKQLVNALHKENHSIWVLTRGNAKTLDERLCYVHWDGVTNEGWGALLSTMDVVINLAGEPLTRWPWTKNQKKIFAESRVLAGGALSKSIQETTHRPKFLLQVSGINHYGIFGESATEYTPPGTDYLACLTQDWENSTSIVETLGVRRCVTRLAVVLDRKGGLFPLMALPIRLFFGGPDGSGEQIVPWIHIEDVIGAISFLIYDENARGPYNLVAPEIITNADFNKNIAREFKRPYWFRIPAFLLKLILGEMSVLILGGRGAYPERLVRAGYKFKFTTLQAAVKDLQKKKY